MDMNGRCFVINSKSGASYAFGDGFKIAHGSYQENWVVKTAGDIPTLADSASVPWYINPLIESESVLVKRLDWSNMMESPNVGCLGYTYFCWSRQNIPKLPKFARQTSALRCRFAHPPLVQRVLRIRPAAGCAPFGHSPQDLPSFQGEATSSCTKERGSEREGAAELEKEDGSIFDSIYFSPK